ncbi:MAG: hypothetical protein N2588_09520 [Rhodovarius sp.]|nr:hypothetical protein [Rhodovarius sp.]
MLAALPLLIALLPLLALPAALGWRRLTYGAAAFLALSLAGVALAALAGSGRGAMALPLGPPWGAMLVGLDALGAFFLLVFGLSSALPLALPGAEDRRGLLAIPLLLCGGALAAAAQDGFTFLLGIELAWLGAWAGLATGPEVARRFLAQGLVGGACLMAAMGLLSAGAGSLSFTAMAAAPPEAALAAGAFLLAAVGLIAKAGLWPAGPAPDAAAPAPGAMLAVLALPLLALLAGMRLLAVLPGPAQPGGWALPLLMFGAATLLAGGSHALAAPSLAAVAAGLARCLSGLMVMALAAGLLLRGADLTPAAAPALAAALLLALVQLPALGLLLLAAPASGSAAAAAAAVLAAATLAALPPSAGFAAAWLLLQAIIGAARLPDVAAHLAVILSLALAGAGGGLAVAALLRALAGGLAMPPAAGLAGPGPLRAALLLPALLLALAGLWPELVLSLAAPVLAEAFQLSPPPIPPLTGSAFADGGAGYAALPLALLLGAVGLLVAFPGRPAAGQVAPWRGGTAAAAGLEATPDRPSGAGLAQPGLALLAPLAAALPRLPPPARGRRLRRRVDAVLRRCQADRAAAVSLAVLAGLLLAAALGVAK